MSKRSVSATEQPDRPVSPPPNKRMKSKVTSTATSQAVKSFFTPASKKGPEKLAWRTVNQSLLVARYNALELDAAVKDEAGNPSKRRKIAAFDFDSTLISTSSGNVFGREANDWKWWHSSVPRKLKQLHDDGYRLAILSNQGGINLNTKGPKPVDPKRLNTFKTKVGFVLNQLDLPLSLYAATSQDLYRKPRTGMWGALLEDYDLKDDQGPDLSHSLFVGDAAGRLAREKVKADHSSSDRSFATNVGISFYTPEEYFLGEESVEWKPTFDPLQYVDQATDIVGNGTGEVTKPPGKSVFEKKHDLDIVIIVGSPGSGKSTFYWTYLEPEGYERANQDILKSRDKCLKVTRGFINEGKSVAVDNTNADKDTRADWVKLAKECKVPIRCIWLQAPPELCKHNDTVRSLGGSEGFNPENRIMLPAMVFAGYQKRFQEPKVDEGFTDVLQVPFKFRGSEDEKRIWGKHWT